MSLNAVQTYDGIKLGDVVTLLSGGPKMTVKGFDSEPLPPGAPIGTMQTVLIDTVWFNEAGAFSFGKFPRWVLSGGSDAEPVVPAAAAA